MMRLLRRPPRRSPPPCSRSLFDTGPVTRARSVLTATFRSPGAPRRPLLVWHAPGAGGHSPGSKPLQPACPPAMMAHSNADWSPASTARCGTRVRPRRPRRPRWARRQDRAADRAEPLGALPDASPRDRGGARRLVQPRPRRSSASSANPAPASRRSAARSCAWCPARRGQRRAAGVRGHRPAAAAKRRARRSAAGASRW